MKTTNKFHLPEPIAEALRLDKYQKQGDYSVTELIGPPRIRELRKRHDDEIEVDVSENVWSLLGSAVHDVINRMDTGNFLQEEILKIEVNGKSVTGRPDLYTERNGGTLYDFKVTSVWTFLLEKEGLREEYVKQVNCYAHMLRKNGFKVRQAMIIAILRDWVSSKAGQNGYPQCAIHHVDVPLWPDPTAAKYIEDRVKEHQATEKIDEDKLPLCSPEERWDKPITWAVFKGKNKRATRVLPTRKEAEKYMYAQSGEFILVERPGESVRCLRYCNAAPFCDFAKGLNHE